MVGKSIPRFTKSPSLVLIGLVLTEIQVFKNVKYLQRNVWKTGQIRTIIFQQNWPRNFSRNSREIGLFSVNLSLKIPRNLPFFFLDLPEALRFCDVHVNLGDWHWKLIDLNVVFACIFFTAGQKIPGVYARPITRAQKLENLQLCMSFMGNRNINLQGIYVGGMCACIVHRSTYMYFDWLNEIIIRFAQTSQ